MQSEWRSDWPLIVFTLLLPVALFTYLGAIILPSDFEGQRRAAVSLSWAFVTSGLALLPFHLGRPLRSPRALIGFRHSWLSREMVFSLIFALFLSLHVFEPLVRIGFVATTVYSLLTVAAGVLALYSGVHVYLTPGRSRMTFGATLGQFGSAGVSLSLLLILVLLSGARQPEESVLDLSLILRLGSLLAFAVLFVDNLQAYLRSLNRPIRSVKILEQILFPRLQSSFKVGLAFSAFSGAMLLFAALYRPDSLFLLLAMLGYILASWSFRVAFFARSAPISVPILSARERRRRLSQAVGIPVVPDSYDDELPFAPTVQLE